MEFSDSEIKELAANIIAELMYAQYGVNGNEYLLSEVFINHRKHESALSVEDQKVIIRERILESHHLAVIFVVSVRTAPHFGKSYPILKNDTQSRLLNML